MRVREDLSGFVVAIATLGLLFVSCGSTPRLYSGPQRDRSQVVLLETAGRNRILEINGRSVSGRSFELLPGPHTVIVKVRFKGEDVAPGAEGQVMTAFCTANFDAVAGHEYWISRGGMTTGETTRDGVGGPSETHLDFQVILRDVTEDRDMLGAIRKCQRRKGLSMKPPPDPDE